MTRKVLSATFAAIVAAAVLLTGTAASAAEALRPLAGSGVEPEPDATPLIIGGSPASQTYHGLGSLQYLRGDNPNFHECEASLWVPQGAVDPRNPRPVTAWHAITNAHCVTVYPTATLEDPKTFRLRFNSGDRLAGGTVTGVRKSKVYHSWAWGTGTGLQGDIAVLWLTKPVRTIPSILRPPAGLKHVPTGPARITGWGYTQYPWDQPDAPRHLSELDTAIVDPSHCAAAVIDAGEVCVADLDNPQASACFGDSGGPVMVRSPHTRKQWFLIGTASRETAIPCVGPVVYTSVLFYQDWIDKVINGSWVDPKPATPARPAKPPAYRWAGCGTSC